MQFIEYKKALLQCPCVFTCAGIKELLYSSCSQLEDNMIVSISSLEQAERLLILSKSFDLVVLTLNSQCGNVAELLDILTHYAQSGNTDSHVIILAEDKCSEALRRYLVDVGNVSLFLESHESIEKLYSQLLGLKYVNKTESNTAISVSRALSMRELNVLKWLLKGKTIEQIANELTLSYKTVSHYKRAAMNKLGVRTLQSLLIPF